MNEDIVARMEALIRRMAADDPLPRMNADYREAADIVAMLPRPIDPDLLAARDIVKEVLNPDSHKNCRCRDEIDAGEWDRKTAVRAAREGIKRGRQLESER